MAAAFSPACRPSPASRVAVEWRHRVLWQGAAKVQSLAVGEFDPRAPGLEVAGADAQGRVILASRLAGDPEVRVVYEHGAKLTGILIADLDPALPGAELYVGGQDAGPDLGPDAGVVVQLSWQGGAVASRVLWRGEGFVHALASLPGTAASEGPALVVTTYAGTAFALNPVPRAMPWACDAMFSEFGDAEARKIKDVVTGRIGGARELGAFVAAKSGRGVLLRRGGGTRVVHAEPGGIARLALDVQGRVYLAGNEGRVLRLAETGEGWHAVVLHDEHDRLRGIATGRFRTSLGTSKLAVYGYAGHCRLLVGGGVGLAAISVYDDGDKGHWLAAAELVPGNDSDELVCAGYSGRIVLVWPSAPTDGIRGGGRPPRAEDGTEPESRRRTR